MGSIGIKGEIRRFVYLFICFFSLFCGGIILLMRFDFLLREIIGKENKEKEKKEQNRREKKERVRE